MPRLAATRDSLKKLDRPPPIVTTVGFSEWRALSLAAAYALLLAMALPTLTTP